MAGGGKGGGTIDGGALTAAAAEFEKMAEDYPDWVQTHIKELYTHCRRSVDTPEERSKYFKRINEIAHDMRGQGGTFGYTLVTEVGNSLCSYLETLEDAGEREMEVVEAHADALRTVIRQKVKGDGGHLGREIVEGLHQAVEKVTG